MAKNGYVNDLIKFEALCQYMNLVMEEQVDEFMNGAMLEEDDYEDWLKWASHKEQQNMHQFGGSMDKKTTIFVRIRRCH